MADVDRCPRCAYPLTGLHGAPERVGGAFRDRVHCPECALEIPAGAHSICGGATAGIVEPGAIRSTGAIVVAAAVAIGGPWLCIMGTVLVLQLVRSGVPRSGYSFGQVAGTAFGLAPVFFGLTVAAYFLWRRWRPIEGAEHAGAIERRALVAPGAIYLWQGEPSATAPMRALAAGDVREVRGRKHMPLFPRKGAPAVAGIAFVTPLSYWASSPVRAGWRANWSLHQKDGTVFGLSAIWLRLPPGVGAEQYALELERALRTAPAADTPREDPARAADDRALEVRAVRAAAAGATEVTRVERLAIPVTRTAGTPGEPPICPRCGAALSEDAATQGMWWEPLPAPVRCGACGFEAPGGALVLQGFAHASQAAVSPRAAPWIGGAIAGFMISMVLGMLMATGRIGGGGLRGFGIVLMTLAALTFSGVLTAAVARGRRPVARPRARFQRGTLTWVVQPGALRVVVRGKRGREQRVPARGISRVEFRVPMMAENQMPVVETESLVASGTASELGLIGEIVLSIPLPAEVTTDQVEQAVMRTLRAPIAPL